MMPVSLFVLLCCCHSHSSPSAATAACDITARDNPQFRPYFNALARIYAQSSMQEVS